MNLVRGFVRMGYMTLWCGTCSAQDHRDTLFYEPPLDRAQPSA